MAAILNFFIFHKIMLIRKIDVISLTIGHTVILSKSFALNTLYDYLLAFLICQPYCYFTASFLPEYSQCSKIVSNNLGSLVETKIGKYLSLLERIVTLHYG